MTKGIGYTIRDVDLITNSILFFDIYNYKYIYIILLNIYIQFNKISY